MDNIVNKKITIIGSTGSIGTQTLDICEHLGIEVVGLAVNRSIETLKQQINKFHPKYVAVFDEKEADKLRADLPAEVKLFVGMSGLCELASVKVDYVVTSLVGVAGLVPTMAAINAGNDIALANKETLVAAGDIVMSAAKEKGVKILPVDSEHSAIFQSINDSKNRVKKIFLTASGGPFFGQTKEQLKTVCVGDALKHPNWSMGSKITIDCSTMMNKGLEEIEAMHLFGVGINDIEVVVHRESVVHSAVEFCDHSVIAQLGVPDMRIPIQYALTYPHRMDSISERVNLFDVANLSFYKPDRETFRCLSVCEEAAKKGGLYPAAVNAANEVAVARFLNNQISFLEIAEIVEKPLFLDLPKTYTSVEEVLAVDKEIRQRIEKGE